MNTPILLAETIDRAWWSPIFLTLGWIFATAALVWLIIWLLFYWGQEDEASEQEESGADTSADNDAAAKLKADEASAKAKADADATAKAAADAAAKAEANLSGDDFTKLGLSAAASKGLWADGVTEYSQIADWKKGDTEGYSGKVGADHPDVNFDELPWKANALAGGVDLDSISADDPAFGAPHQAAEKVDHDAVIKGSFEGEDVKNDADLGIVYVKSAKPGHEDDLKEIKGVGPKLSEALNDHGVYCFKQIANWSDHNVAEFSERMNCFKDRIERDRWIPQASSMECVAAVEEEEGEIEFKAASVDEARSLFSDELESGSVRQDDVYGIVYDGPPADGIDDLKKIKGVGKVLEGKLNEVGVYRFKQVAVWTDAACEEFSGMMSSFKDRIYRDNWIAQAKKIHEEKYDEKL